MWEFKTFSLAIIASVSFCQKEKKNFCSLKGLRVFVMQMRTSNSHVNAKTASKRR